MGIGGLQFEGTVALLVVACLAFPAWASALEPGVHVDPGSPAAKEYVLPLNQARATGGDRGSRSSSEGSLFGAGIKPPSSGGSSGGSARAARPPVTGSAGPHVLGRLTLHEVGNDSSGGNGSTLALIGGAVAIVVLGGFGGTVLRRSRRPSAQQ